MTSLLVSVLGIGIVRSHSIGYWVLGAELGIVLTLIFFYVCVTASLQRKANITHLILF